MEQNMRVIIMKEANMEKANFHGLMERLLKEILETTILKALVIYCIFVVVVDQFTRYIYMGRWKKICWTLVTE